MFSVVAMGSYSNGMNGISQSRGFKSRFACGSVGLINAVVRVRVGSGGVLAPRVLWIVTERCVFMRCRVLFLCLCLPFAASVVLSGNAPVVVSTDGEGDGVWSFLPDIVGEIDGKKVSRVDLLEFLRKRTNPVVFRGFDARDFKSYAREVFEQYSNQVIMAELASEDGYPALEMVFRETKRWLDGASKGERESFERYLKKEGVTLKAYCAKNAAARDADDLRQIAIDAWTREKIAPGVKISEEDVKIFYDNSAEVVKVSQILVKPAGNTKAALDSARKRAEGLLARLKAGEEFNKLASTESDCTRPNGDLGTFARGEMVEEFDDVAFKMKKGEVSGVFQTMFGYHIIRLDAAWKRELPPLDAALKARIRERLKAMRTQDFLIGKLRDAKKKRQVKVFF